MRYVIPLLIDRVAPRCTSARSLMIVDLRGKQVADVQSIVIDGELSTGLVQTLAEHGADALVCGGIEGGVRRSIEAQGMTVIDNVACSTAELFAAIAGGTLRSGFGFSTTLPPRSNAATEEAERVIDCLACADRACLRGERCAITRGRSQALLPSGQEKILEAALDVALENERILCRISELVYFCLEMGYRKLGLPFCLELLEPVEMLTRLLRRFFEVVPVCCKVGGRRAGEGRTGSIACNPLGQAEALNGAGTDINVLVGLCLGMDSVFQRASTAPVTTLIVKDKSLAHNPIGALYSDYYMKEVARTSIDSV